MSDATLPPEPWRPLYEGIGVDFGYRQLANRIGMDHTTLRRLLKGGRTSEATIRKVADAFHVTPAKIRELRGESAALEYEPFVLPDDAGRLNEKERRVIMSVIRALLDAKNEASDSSDNPEDRSWGRFGGDPSDHRGEDGDEGQHFA